MAARNKQGVRFTIEEEHYSHVTELARQLGLPLLYIVAILICLYRSYCPPWASLTVYRAAIVVRMQFRIRRAAAAVVILYHPYVHARRARKMAVTFRCNICSAFFPVVLAFAFPPRHPCIFIGYRSRHHATMYCCFGSDITTFARDQLRTDRLSPRCHYFFPCTHVHARTIQSP